MNEQIIKEKTYNHPIDRVWKAITEEGQISKWFIHADFKAEVGYQYTFTATEEHGSTKVFGKVLEADPYTLKYTWSTVDSPIETTVTWSLQKMENGTQLTLKHAQIGQYGEAAAEVYGHFDKGWDACLFVLPNYLDGESTQPAH